MKNLFILMLLISFGSIGAVFFTPGLPEMAQYFNISNAMSEWTITWYLIGYSVGQLLYGPMAHSLGGCKTILMGALLALLGSAICIIAGYEHSFVGLLIGRTMMGAGAGSGLKMTFTISTFIYSQKEAARKVTLLTLAFAIMPGLGVFIGGYLVHWYGWLNSFYLMVVYSLMIAILSYCLPEIYSKEERHAFHFADIFINYAKQLKNSFVISSGLLVGICSASVYIFAAVAPFIGMQLMHLSPERYGAYNLFPALGMVSSSLISSYFSPKMLPTQAIKLGLSLLSLGTVLLLAALLLWPENPLSLFVPMVVIYLGPGFIFANALNLGLEKTADKSNGSAMISFLNMASSCVWVLALANVHIHHATILPMLFIILVALGVTWYHWLISMGSE